MRLAFSPRAIEDIQAVGDYIRDDNPSAALRFVDELTERCARITAVPHAGTARPDLGRTTRSVPFRRYTVFYDVDDDAVTIRRILHSARDIGAAYHDG